VGGRNGASFLEYRVGAGGGSEMGRKTTWRHGKRSALSSGGGVLKKWWDGVHVPRVGSTVPITMKKQKGSSRKKKERGINHSQQGLNRRRPERGTKTWGGGGGGGWPGQGTITQKRAARAIPETRSLHRRTKKNEELETPGTKRLNLAIGKTRGGRGRAVHTILLRQTAIGEKMKKREVAKTFCKKRL